MAESSAAGSRALSLQDLIALNDELAALMRAGVPLERTLGDMGRDLPGRLGRATAQLAERIDRGASLPQALEAMPDAFPKVYRAAVEAGLRSGDLPAVLESLSVVTRRISELRRALALAALYPLIVVLIAVGLFEFLVIKVLPTFLGAFESHSPQWLKQMTTLGDGIKAWGPILTNFLILAVFAWWFLLRRSPLRGSRLPWLRGMFDDGRLAVFCELLALLVERATPLPEALCLAADATGNAPLSQAAAKLAEQLRAAQRPGESDPSVDPRPLAARSALGPAGLPPFLLWLIGAGARQQTLVSFLQHTAEMYRRRALRRSDWLRVYLPMLLTVFIGGVVTLLFSLSLFVPLTELLIQVSRDGISFR
jgi:general secretion pathway protein F